MAGTGPDPKTNRRRSNVPVRGDWQIALGIGWQHGDVPKPPTGPPLEGKARPLTKGAREAWETWMRSWFAWFWTPEDLPALRQIVRLYDQVERGAFQRANEMRLQMDAYGITPKGQQDRRWMVSVVAVEQPDDEPATTASTYDHLRLVSSDA
jgi:hypothetical protein